MRSYCRLFPTVFKSAHGSELFDVKGRRYLDFFAGASALNYGHNDPDLVQAAVEHLLAGEVLHGLDLHTEAKALFIETFCRLILQPRGLDYRLQFTGPTGTNAIEAALKLARKVTGRQNVIAFTRAFHGMTLGALAATANIYYKDSMPLHWHGVTRAFYDGYFGPDVDTAKMLDTLLSDPFGGVEPPAAILVEAVQGEGGLNAASNGWLCSLADIARRHGALLILDEIQCGVGRTGSFFSFESAGIQPDLVTLSKSLSGLGLPMALLLIKPEFDVWKPGEHNGTFRGNNLAFKTAKVSLEKYWSDDSLMRDVGRRNTRVSKALHDMARMVAGATVKGRGLFMGLNVRSAKLAASVSQKCFQNGLIIETCGPECKILKLLPPLTISDEQLEEGLAILKNAIEQEVVKK